MTRIRLPLSLLRRRAYGAADPHAFSVMAGPSDRYPCARRVVVSTFLTATVALGLACDEAPLQPPAAIQPPAATRLGFIAQPTSAQRARRIKPAVQAAIQDAFGNTVPTTSTLVTVKLGANPNGAILFGSTTARTVSGIATFPNLRIDRPGPAYTLIATAAPHGEATSEPFAIGPQFPP